MIKLGWCGWILYLAQCRGLDPVSHLLAQEKANLDKHGCKLGGHHHSAVWPLSQYPMRFYGKRSN